MMPPDFGKCRICGSAEGSRDWAGTNTRPVHVDPRVCNRVLVERVAELEAGKAILQKELSIGLWKPKDGE
jgi:hypothetical protein